MERKIERRRRKTWRKKKKERKNDGKRAREHQMCVWPTAMCKKCAHFAKISKAGKIYERGTSFAGTSAIFAKWEGVSSSVQK